MSPRPVITFLSDYGLEDHFVGVCHGVIAGICPDAVVIDLTHGIRRHDVMGGALTLRAALPFMPTGVHLAVVDPDVGARRRAVALECDGGQRLVGPNNGLLSLASAALGGVVEAVDVSVSPFRLEPVSATFHGRDLFAPVAARLAAGESLSSVGDPIDPAQLVALQLRQPRRGDGELIAHVLYVDRFGNLQLDIGHDDMSAIGCTLGREVRLGESELARYARTFADVRAGQLLVYEDADHALAVAVTRGSAAERLGLGVGDELRVAAAVAG